MGRHCFFTEVKHGKLAQYRHYHDNIFPEVARGLRAAGIIQLTIFLVPGTRKLVMYIETAGDIDLARATGPGSIYRRNARCKYWEELMDSDFHGGWTKCEEIHSSDKEWNKALQLPAGASSHPTVAPTPASRPPKPPPAQTAPAPSTKAAAPPTAKPPVAPPASADPQTVARYKRDSLMQNLKTRTLANGQYGIRALSRAFHRMDRKRSGCIGREDAYYGFQQQALPINAKELQILINAFQRNNDCKFYYKNFIRVLRGPVSDGRKAVVARAFQSLPGNNSGEVALGHIKQCYDASRHPSVVAGSKSQASVLRQFQHHFNEVDGPNQGVNFAEFAEYFYDLSANIPDDRDFQAIATAWRAKAPAPAPTTPAKPFGERRNKSPSNRIRQSPGGKTSIAFSGGKVPPRSPVRGSQKRATGNTAGGKSSIVFG